MRFDGCGCYRSKARREWGRRPPSSRRHALPDATLRPAIVPVVDRCRRPIDGRNVAPSTACLQDMQDARDDRAVSVDPRLARPATRQVRAERPSRPHPDSHNKLFRHDDRPQRLKSGVQIYNQNQLTAMSSQPGLGTQVGPCDDGGERTRLGEIVSSEAVVSGCDASPILELAEQAFDDVSALIGGAIERVWRAPRGGGGNGRSDLPMLEPSAQDCRRRRPCPPARALVERQLSREAERP